MLRRKDPSNPDGQYKVYTPNELWKEGDATLQQLKDEKEAGLSKGNKLGEETPLEVGATVRLKDIGKMKSGMSKGFKQNWSKELYEIIRVKVPPRRRSLTHHLHLHLNPNRNHHRQLSPSQRSQHPNHRQSKTHSLASVSSQWMRRARPLAKAPSYVSSKRAKVVRSGR
jgi:hypothetical protein